MSQVVTTGGAPAAAPQPADPHFPQVPLAQGLHSTAKVVDVHTGEASIQKSPEPSLAEVIKAQRADREARTREEARAKDLSAKLDELAKENEALKRSQFESDVLGYARARQWTREQQLLFGQTLLYDLAPDQAPPEFRERLFEDKLTRREREAEEKQRQAQTRAAQEARERSLASYQAELNKPFETVDEGSFPESSAWFTDPDSEVLDRDAYIESLMHTANNMAEAAAAKGGYVDLSPASVASVLETEVARRFALRDRRAATRTKAVAREGASGEQTATDTLSSRNMNGSGSPLPPAASDDERIRRAVQKGFRVK